MTEGEIQEYIIDQSGRIAGQVLRDAIEKVGLEKMVGIGAAVDILAQATGRIASILVQTTDKREEVLEGIYISMRAYMDNFEKYMGERNVALGKDKED